LFISSWPRCVVVSTEGIIYFAEYTGRIWRGLSHGPFTTIVNLSGLNAMSNIDFLIQHATPDQPLSFYELE